MSKIGLKSVFLPAGVKVTLEGASLVVEGPKGKLAREIPPLLEIEVREKAIKLERKRDHKEARSLHGLYRNLIANMVQGVGEGFLKVLEIKGVGFRAEKTGEELKLSVGFSHPVILPIPKGVEVAIEGPLLKISGIDKEIVHSFAAVVRSVKPPEIYKGKGIRHQGEMVTLKPGKSAKGAGVPGEGGK